jgi:membrane-associated phospholipid phosphatase
MRRTQPSQEPLVASRSSYTTGRRLRACEWALIVFFLYIAGISPAFHLRSQLQSVPFVIAAGVLALIVALAYAEDQPKLRRAFSYARDWVPLVLVLTAYREMDWFTPKYSDHHLEKLWIQWDRVALHGTGLQWMIDRSGSILPNLLELSYLLVYAIGPFSVAILYIIHRRDVMGKVLFVYVVGTVAAYGLFPYFPSSPPRAVFPGMDLPSADTLVRRLNLFLVGDYGIHSSVFPSAHVSSAFSAAWALLMYLPERRRLGLGMLIYAFLVSMATVYGRYHYAVDALAGFGIGIGAALLGAWVFRRASRTDGAPIAG